MEQISASKPRKLLINILRSSLHVGLPPYADVDVFSPARRQPLAAGDELQLALGDCIAFLASGTVPEPALSLDLMLQTHLP